MRKPKLLCLYRGKDCMSYRLKPGVKTFGCQDIPWLAKRVFVGGLTFEYPDFIQWHPANKNLSNLPEDHSFWYPKRGFLKHVLTESFCFRLHQLIELPLIKLRNNYTWSKRHLPMKGQLYHIVGFFLGLNCGYGAKAVQYTNWMLRYGGRPLSVRSANDYLNEELKKHLEEQDG